MNEKLRKALEAVRSVIQTQTRGWSTEQLIDLYDELDADAEGHRMHQKEKQDEVD